MGNAGAIVFALRVLEARRVLPYVQQVAVMVQRFTIQGRLPGLNEIIAAAKKKPAGVHYNRLKHEAELLILDGIRRSKVRPVSTLQTLNFCWYEPNKKRDKDNIAAGKKFILDALVGAGILPGDGWGYVAGWRDTFDVSKAPKIIVELQAV